MKKIITSLSAILLFIAGNVHAQFVVTGPGSTNDISMYEHNALTSGQQQIQIKFKNQGATDSYVLTRLRLTVSAGWTDALCWGAEGDPFGSCYGVGQMPTNPWTTPNPVNLAFNGVGILLADIYPDAAANGSGHYRYYIHTVGGEPVDSLDLIVNSNLLSVKKNDQSNLSVTVYPNPANDLLTITLPGNSAEGTAKIMDVLGKVIFEEKISSSKKLNTEEFKNGVYILTVHANGSMYTKRFVVKH